MAKKVKKVSKAYKFIGPCPLTVQRLLRTYVPGQIVELEEEVAQIDSLSEASAIRRMFEIVSGEPETTVEKED